MAICLTCKKLWKDYTDAVHAHIETVRKSHGDTLRQDSLALMKSEWLERASVQKRQKVRKALTEHQVTHLIRELETQPRRLRPVKQR